ncbi:MAG: hypothetical protein ABWY03_10505 [Microbacterium sp.]
MTDSPAAVPLRRTLNVGGVLLIVSAVLTFAQPTFFTSPLAGVLSWTATAAFSIALLVFAFGLGRGGSIVARRALGVAAAVVAAVWPLVERVLTWVLPYENALAFYGIWGYVSLTVMLAAMIVFVVQIARAGVLRGRVRWMPLWGLVLVAAPQILAQLLVVALNVDFRTDDQEWIFLVFGLGQLLSFAVPVGLGIIALVVANRPTPVGDPVQVYPPG